MDRKTLKAWYILGSWGKFGTLIRICRKTLILCHVRDTFWYTKFDFDSVIFSNYWSHAIFGPSSDLYIEPGVQFRNFLITNNASNPQLLITFWFQILDYFSILGKMWEIFTIWVQNHVKHDNFLEASTLKTWLRLIET